MDVLSLDMRSADTAVTELRAHQRPAARRGGAPSKAVRPQPQMGVLGVSFPFMLLPRRQSSVRNTHTQAAPT